MKQLLPENKDIILTRDWGYEGKTLNIMWIVKNSDSKLLRQLLREFWQ